MFRIALISPPYGGSSNSMRPIGLMALASYLEHEFRERVEVKLLDYSDCQHDDYAAFERDGVSGYDLVGLCAYSTNFPIVRDWALALKRQNPGLKTVIGGPHATSLPEHIAEHHRDAFDFVVRGEGERPLTALVAALMTGARPPRVPGLMYKDRLGLVRVGTTDPVRDLNTVPTPIAAVYSPYESSLVCYDRKLGRMRKAFAFTTSRGCPFSCTFCSIRAADSKWRAVGAERLGDWIADALARDPEIEHINFMDADFLIDKKRVKAIGDMLERRHPGKTWSFSARVDDLARLGEPALQRLSRQGLLAVEVGFESGSQAMLDRMGKRVSVQENYDAIAMLRRCDLDFLIDFILFLPDETPEQLRESLTFLKNAQLTDYLPHDHYYTSLVQYPATPLRPFYERLFGTTFSMDELPDPADLFDHPGTKQIYRFFVGEFSQRSQSVLPRLIEEVDASARHYAATDRRRAQYLRIEGQSLRNLPYLVLEALLDAEEAGTLLRARSLSEAVPWLKGFDDHVSTLEELCRERREAA